MSVPFVPRRVPTVGSRGRESLDHDSSSDVAAAGRRFEGLENRELLAAGVTEYKIPTTLTFVNRIVKGADNNLWFTEASATANKVGKITPVGSITEYTARPAGSLPWGITVGPDEALGSPRSSAVRSAGSTPAGTSPSSRSTRPGRRPASSPGGSCSAPTAPSGSPSRRPTQIGRITTAGAVTEYKLPNGGGPENITVGPDKPSGSPRSRATRSAGSTPAGTSPSSPSRRSSPTPPDIVSGPGGLLWFTEDFYGKIATITTAGAVTEYTVPTNNSSPTGITVGPNGDLFFAEHGGATSARSPPPA